MYYYVFEAVKDIRIKKTYEKIKALLNECGIAGEIAISSPARTAEELAQIGIEKNYSTIVAVGSDRHINSIASVIKTVKPTEKSKEVVLGVIPTDLNSSLKEKLGLDNPKLACETLKFRKVEDLDIAYIEPNRYFLTTAEIHTPNPVPFELTIDHFQIKAKVSDLIVFSNMTITVFSQPKVGFFKKLFGRFQEPLDPKAFSIFKARVIQIHAPTNLPITIEGEVATRTPAMLYRRPRALKVIVRRDRLIAGS